MTCRGRRTLLLGAAALVPCAAGLGVAAAPAGAATASAGKTRAIGSARSIVQMHLRDRAGGAAATSGLFSRGAAFSVSYRSSAQVGSASARRTLTPSRPVGP
jgi:hypothetical protein